MDAHEARERATAALRTRHAGVMAAARQHIESAVKDGKLSVEFTMAIREDSANYLSEQLRNEDYKVVRNYYNWRNESGYTFKVEW